MAKAIPNDSFNRYGGIYVTFFTEVFCNYDSKLLDKQPPLFYGEMLDYYIFKELHTGHPDVRRSEFILWNNKEITI